MSREDPTRPEVLPSSIVLALVRSWASKLSMMSWHHFAFTRHGGASGQIFL